MSRSSSGIRDLVGVGSVARLQASRTPVVMLDIGSTVIKGLRLDVDGSLASVSQPRHAGLSLADQARKTLSLLGTAETTLICSSANGGLRIGLLSLSSRYSGSLAARSIGLAGANVIYAMDWRRAATAHLQPAVDLLVIVGGVDAFPGSTTCAGIMALAAAAPGLSNFPRDRLIFAGHRGAREVALASWPDVMVVANPLRDAMSVGDHELEEHVRNTFLDDIVSKRELAPLRGVADAPIAPTPGIVAVAFRRLLRRFAGPAIMLDIGGSTTDVHFPREVEAISGGVTPPPGAGETGCHVHTALGVADSRQATLRALLADRRCADVMLALHGDGFRGAFAELQDGEADDRTAFAACLYLALRRAREPSAPGPRLNLERIATVAVTGGASQVLGEPQVRTLLAIASESDPGPVTVVLDRNYCWWGLGLLPVLLADASLMEKMDV